MKRAILQMSEEGYRELFNLNVELGFISKEVKYKDWRKKQPNELGLLYG